MGFIPQGNNLILSRLMDAGKELFGMVRVNERVGDYRHIVVKVYMHE